MQGDGESLPETPPNETAAPPGVEAAAAPATAHNPFQLSLTVDGMAVLLLVAGLATRLARLESPRHVVFDEMHYGKYASLYLKNIFFFDSNPPLGKMMIAAAGYLAGFDGRFRYKEFMN